MIIGLPVLDDTQGYADLILSLPLSGQKRGEANILIYFDSYITNAVSEGLNSRIQLIKSNGKGYRNFEIIELVSCFSCGKLDMHPQ